MKCEEGKNQQMHSEEGWTIFSDSALTLVVFIITYHNNALPHTIEHSRLNPEAYHFL